MLLEDQIHREAKAYAARKGLTLQQAVAKAVLMMLKRDAARQEKKAG